MKKKVLKLVSGSLVCGLLVVILFVFSEKINSSSNSFLRKLPSHAVSLLQEFNLESNIWLLAGATSNTVYLRNRKYANILNVINWKTRSQYRVIIDNTSKIRFKAPKLSIDSPRISVSEDNTIYGGELRVKKLSKLFEFQKSFADFAQVGSNSFIVRWLDLKKGWFLGYKNGEVTKELAISAITGDSTSVFSNDGMLAVCKTLNTAVFLNYYSNQFFVIDADFNVIHRGMTIDTVHSAQIKVSSTRRGISLLGPTIPVNKQMIVDSIYMYVRSALRGDNEIASVFNNVTVIDKYNLSTGAYMFSLYLQDLQGEKVKDFFVVKNYVYALYKTKFCIYKMADRLRKN